MRVRRVHENYVDLFRSLSPGSTRPRFVSFFMLTPRRKRLALLTVAVDGMTPVLFKSSRLDVLVPWDWEHTVGRHARYRVQD